MNNVLNRKRGSSVIELCLALFIIVPLVLLSVDAGFLFFGCAFGSTACREAARWASNGAPADVTSAHSGVVGSGTGPYLRAVNALSTFRGSRVAGFDSASLQVSETITDPVPAAPFGGMANGNVTVSMQVTVAPPIPLPFMPSYVQFPVQESFPYTWVMPATPS
jgi:hypothetical protein